MNKHFKCLAAAGLMALFMGTAAAVPQATFSQTAIVALAANEQITNNGVTYELNASAKTAAIVKLDSSKKSFTTSTSIKYNNVTYSINEIAGYACTNMPNLTSLTISGSIKKIGRMAFGNCKKLETVKINGTPTIESDLFYGCSALKNVTLNSAITSLGASMFEGCTSLTSITLPSKLTTIGQSAFQGCSKLTSVSVPASVKTISISAFDRCTALKTVTLRSGLTTINNYAFRSCTALTSVSIPDSVTTLGQAVFQDCSALTSAKLPSKLTVLGSYLFCDCAALKSIEIPSKLTTIQSGVFNGCKALSIPSFPSTLKTIGENAFTGTTSFTGTLVIPKTVTSLGNCCFKGCGVSAVESKGSAAIGVQAFAELNKLTKVTLTGSEKLGFEAFKNCQNLSNIVVPLTSASDWNATTFDQCTKLWYLNGNRVSYSYNSSKDDVIFSGTGVDAFVRKRFNASEGVGFVESYVNYFCNIEVTRLLSSGMTDQEKAKVLHDWVIKKVDYDHDNVNAPKNHCVCSIFLNDTTVCEGFAMGYAKLMNTAGIETTEVDGGNHAWNKAKIGGLYFNIDTCWDDGSGSYDWFMLTDKELLEKDSSSHKPYNANAFPASVYPMGDLNMNKVVDQADIDLFNKYLLGNGTLNSKQAVLADFDHDSVLDSFDMIFLKRKFNKRFDLNGDGTVNNQDRALQQYYIVKQGKKAELKQRSDVNNDGVIDEADAIEMRNYLQKYCGLTASSYYRMGDLNRDGKLNNNDLTLLYNHLNAGHNFTTIQKQLADFDNNGIVDSNDLNLMNTLLNYKLGDVNRDGKVDQTDKDLVMKHIVGTKNLASTVLWYADYNGDGVINIQDVVLMCRDYNISD